MSSTLTKPIFPEEIGDTLGIAVRGGRPVRVISSVVGGFPRCTAGPPSSGVLGVALMLWQIPFIRKRALLVSEAGCPATV